MHSTTPSHPSPAGAASRTAAHFLVSGLVQGVGFRAATRRQAELLGLDGFARNLSDGRVEVVAEGPSAAIEQLALWLAQGPAGAMVEEVRREAAQPAGRHGFATG